MHIIFICNKAHRKQVVKSFEFGKTFGALHGIFGGRERGL